jgi:hypothetical protein
MKKLPEYVDYMRIVFDGDILKRFDDADSRFAVGANHRITSVVRQVNASILHVRL